MLKWLVRLFIVMMLGAVLGVASLIGIYFYIKPQLPDVTALRDVKLATPMKVYSRDGELISQFGEIRRIPLRLDEIPQSMIDAVLATEDARFYEHPGIDPIGIIRAATVGSTPTRMSKVHQDGTELAQSPPAILPTLKFTGW